MDDSVALLPCTQVKLGMCKYGYIDAFCVGAHGSNANCKAFRLRLTIQMTDGSFHNISTTGADVDGGAAVNKERRDGVDGVAAAGSTSPSPTAHAVWSQTTAADPIRYAHLYHGETFDGRMNQTNVGWDQPTTHQKNDEYGKGWGDVVLYQNAAAEFGAMTLFMGPTVSVTEEFTPESFKKVHIGNASAWVFDFGRGISGFARLHVKGLPPGTRILLKYGEVIYPYDNTGAVCCVALCPGFCRCP
jgi:hypothetical protein